MDFKLQDISNGTKKTQIRVRMTKLWPYEVGAKQGTAAALRRLGSVLGGFLAHFEPIMKSFKAQTRKRQGGGG